ncbi:MAG: PAS domain S-box protein [Anaerolineales bacterium]
MKHRTASSSPDHSKWGSLQIAAGYLLLGVLWILFSDKLAARMAPNANALSQIGIYKGWGYVLVTAILLYWLISRYARTIHDANERYKLIAENSSDVIWLYNPSRNKLNYISPSILRLRGYTAEEVMSQPLSASFPADDFEQLNRLNQERFSLFQAKGSGTVSYADEIVYLHRDGSLISTEATTTYFLIVRTRSRLLG